MSLSPLSVVLLAFLLLMLPACTTPAAPKAFDIPRLDKPAVDANAAAWGETGFRVNVLSEIPVGTTVQPSPSFRLAWNDRGLLVLLTVHDTTPCDPPVAANPANPNAPVDDSKIPLWKGDSVELYIARADQPKQRYQMTISPGTTQRHPEPRHDFYDQRGNTDTPKTLAVPSYKRTVLADGYQMEILFPWENLQLTPASGVELLFQVSVYDYNSAGRLRRYCFFPSLEAFRSTEAMYRLRLAGQASPSVEAVANGEYQRYRRALIRVLATPALQGSPVEVTEGTSVLATGVLPTAAQDATASLLATHLLLPMPQKPYGPLTVSVNHQPITTFTIAPPRYRIAELDRVNVSFDSFILTSSQLPTGDFTDPLYVEDLIGPYTLTTTFYNADYQPVTKAEKPGRYGAIVTIQPAVGEAYQRYYTFYRTPTNYTWRNSGGQHAITWHDVKFGSVSELPSQLGLDPAVARNQSEVITEQAFKGFRSSMGENDGWASLLAGLAEIPADAPKTVQRTGPSGLSKRWWAGLRRSAENFQYPYTVTKPTAYTDTGTDKFPLIVYLHGSAERLDPAAPKDPNPTPAPKDQFQTPGDYAKAHPDFPFLVVSPTCPKREWWNPYLLNALLDEICAKYRVDPDRIYLTGLSLGGYGTWDTAMVTPERFAAIVPICGVPDQEDMARLVNLPTWAFHGDADPSVPYKDDLEAVTVLQNLHGRAKFTTYPGVGHDAWTPTYSNPAMYEWLLQQKRNAPAEPPAK